MREASGRPAKSAGKTRATDARPLKDIYEMAWVFYFLGSAAKMAALQQGNGPTPGGV